MCNIKISSKYKAVNGMQRVAVISGDCVKRH